MQWHSKFSTWPLATASLYWSLSVAGVQLSHARSGIFVLLTPGPVHQARV